MFDFFKFLFNEFPESMKYYQYWYNVSENVAGNTDSEPINEKGLSEKIKTYKDRMINYNWIDSNGNFNPPVYIKNSYGFRTQIEYQNNIPIALGCSNTFGKGNHLEHTWPYLLSKKINEKIINFGICGGSMDSSYRVLKSYLDTYTPNKVFLLIPNPFRAEHYVEVDDTKLHIQIGPNFHKSFYEPDTAKSKFQKKLFDMVYSLEESIYLNFHKNLDAIRFLCKENDIELFEVFDPCMWNQNGIMDNSNLNMDRHFSFDLNHFGPEFQEWVSELFIEKINTK